MNKDIQKIIYDENLGIEISHFTGLRRSFPNHFHEYYVIGFIENGKRTLSCKNNEYNIRKGDIIVFNPGDNHCCKQVDKNFLDYICFHIPKNIMFDLTEKVTGFRELPFFSQNVIYNEELIFYFRSLFRMITGNIDVFSKQKMFLDFISILIFQYVKSFKTNVISSQYEIQKVCEFIRTHLGEKIYLRELSFYSGFSKSKLLRMFTKEKGITPYRYLESIRISEAKRLLKNGLYSVDVATQTGFSDQSHFINNFTKFLGFTPNAYREIYYNKKKDCE